MRGHKGNLRRIASIVGVMALLIAMFPISPTRAAAQITSRSLTLVATGTDGGSKANGVVAHQFAFTLPTTGNVGSIQFQYCTLASGSCTLPSGLVTTSATLLTQTGATGFTIVNGTNGSPYITRTAASITGPLAVTYKLGAITNPTANNTTFFVRISTFVATNATGSAVDSGTVAASTASPIILSGTMPESLVFCTGATISLTGGIPDCGTATSGTIAFNQLFSPSDTATATSQMAASTNAGAGYSITVNGATLTSGSNTITGMATTGVGVHNTSQFGLNLRANTTATSTVAVGADISAASNGTNLRGQPAAGYGTIDQFKFVSGNSVADSANGGAGGSDIQIYTASYIVNVPGSQPAGTYSTTLTYICTPTY